MICCSCSSFPKGPCRCLGTPFILQDLRLSCGRSANAAAGSLTFINPSCLPEAEDGTAVQSLLRRQGRAIRLMSGGYCSTL